MMAIRRFVSVAFCCGAAACSTSPSVQLYSLSAVSAAPMSAASTSATAVDRIILTGVAVPASVDRPQIVLLTGPGRLALSDEHRWAEALKRDIARTVSDQLTRALNGAEVWASVLVTPTDADVRVALDVQRFDSLLNDSAQLEVLWTVRRGAVERTGRTVAQAPAPGGYDALVAAHVQALAMLSRDLAAAIRALPPARR